MNPLVTVITASYNSEETIGATIRSVNNQTYLNIEHILIDGCSADNTVEIFSNNSSHINLIISERDRGIYDAMNKGIDAANGEIIFILNSDDLFFDDYVVLNCVKDFVKNPDVELLYGSIQIVDRFDVSKIKRMWHPGNYKKSAFAKSWHPPHPGVVVKKSVYEKHGRFDDTFTIAADYAWLLRVFEVNTVITKLYEGIVVSQRHGGQSMSLKGIITGNIEIWRALKLYGVKVSLTYFFYKRYSSKIRQKININKE